MIFIQISIQFFFDSSLYYLIFKYVFYVLKLELKDLLQQ